MKRNIKTQICTAIFALSLISLLTGCADKASSVNKDGELADKKFAFVVKSAGNENMKKMTEGFQSVIEPKGGEVIVKEPSYATNDQTELIGSLISQDVSGISIAVNDPASLAPMLNEAKSKGIFISAFDSPANPEDRHIFVNQVETEQVGKALVEAVYDITGGSGQWAVLSTTSLAPNQNAWIDAMKSELEKDRKYDGMELVNVVYGNDDAEKSKSETSKLLKEYPDLKVICSPTTIGILAAAETVSNAGSDVKVTGLGLEDEMSMYIGKENVCPYIFFWDSVALGKLTAYTAIALEEGKITGASGETFDAGDLGTFTIQDAENGGTEVILGPLVKID